MRCLIHFLTRGAAGTLETRERIFEGEVLTLGRATDQVLHLKDRRVALEHARIHRRDEHLVIQGLTPAGIQVNGTIARQARLVPGDVVQIGANLLRIQEPVAGFDLVFSFELDAGARADEVAPPVPVTTLKAAGLGKRGWSWLLFVLVLVLTLLLPAAGLLSPPWRDNLRSSVLPADHQWSSGPLAGVHQVLNRDCETCHEQPFVQVRSIACLECHGTELRRHSPLFPQAAARLGRAECTDCHREHDGDRFLVRRDDALCADCHRDLKAVAGPEVGVRPATDFATDHPPFRVTTTVMAPVAGPGGATAWQPQRQRYRPGPGFFDPSGLKFPHDAHLAPGGVESPEGLVNLVCTDCHQPDPGGARFRPVEMERDCSHCHRLDFDPANPARQVPHGPPTAVLDTLVDHYSRRFLESYADPLATARPGAGQRRPGRLPTAAEREAALVRAEEEAGRVARDLIERRACGVCHEVTATPGAPLRQRWEVRPVALTAAWMPAARFRHADHGTALTPCSTCHEAESSAAATDILMPDIAACRDCHGGSGAAATRRNQVATGCGDCHDFHWDGERRWTDPVTTAFLPDSHP